MWSLYTVRAYGSVKLEQDAPTYRQRVSLELPRQETERGLLPGISRRHLPPQLVTNGGAEERVLARGLDGQNSIGSSRSRWWL
jgi:hypothetical protein